ncbi:MAG: hypothetical protein ACI9EF_000295 [Pseudohongiellaceae bacterium]
MEKGGPCQAPPAIATERLRELPDGRISYKLRPPWLDGTTAVVFEPLTFIEKLAALVPPSRAQQMTDHGVLASVSALRSRIVPGPSTSRRRLIAQITQPLVVTAMPSSLGCRVSRLQAPSHRPPRCV